MAEPSLQEVILRSGAWYGDRPVSLAFPSGWRVRVAAPPALRALGDDEIRERLRRPVGARALGELARGKRSAAVIVDDIMRPTPTARLLPLILEELAAAGLPREAVRIVIASGAHSEATAADLRKKVGERLCAELAVVTHHPTRDVTYLGRSARGTPLYVNQAVASAELVLGVGGLYPHPVAGFSGGAKIFMPGVCGVQTVRHVHDSFKGAGQRGGALDNEFRREAEAIAASRLHFIVNVILTPEREVADVFAGDVIAAHREGARAAAERYRTPVIADADVVVANAYPFDTSLYFIPRGFWPLGTVRRSASRVVIADGSMGQGYHGFKPAKQPLWNRVRRGLGALRPTAKGASELRVALTMVKKLVVSAQLEFLMYAPGLRDDELARKFPKSRLFRDWDALRAVLERRHGTGPVTVAVYPCAPLQLPEGRA